MGDGIEIKVISAPPSTVDADQQQQRQRRRRREEGEATTTTARAFTPFKKRVSWLIPGFIVANVIFFIVIMYVNDCPKKSNSCVGNFLGRFSFQPMKENPLLGPTSTTLEKMGALQVDNVSHHHQVWRLFTCIWLHAGVFHVLANMFSLVFIGIRLEEEFGFARVGLIYVMSGIGGSLSSALFIQAGISVGASGALFGLLGSMLSELITNWSLYANKLATLLTLLFIIILNLAMGILPHVDNFAHLGGFISGFLLGFVFLMRPQFGYVNQKYAPPEYSTSSTKPKHKTYQYVLWGISLVLVIIGFVVGLVLLLKGVDLNDYCHWCHYLSCVPTSKWSCNSRVSCESIQTGNQLNLTCSSNGKSEMYSVLDSSTLQLQQLCSQLCS
ncbi:hypothetical protein ACFE04_014207 [Oxalis oulophora]